MTAMPCASASARCRARSRFDGWYKRDVAFGGAGLPAAAPAERSVVLARRVGVARRLRIERRSALPVVVLILEVRSIALARRAVSGVRHAGGGAFTGKLRLGVLAIGGLGLLCPGLGGGFVVVSGGRSSRSAGGHRGRRFSRDRKRRRCSEHTRG